MVVIKIDPFEGMRKNSHIWRGEHALVWYNETLEGSLRLIVLYDFGDSKRRLTLEIDDKNKRVEFKNDTLDPPLYEQLVQEVEMMEIWLRDQKEKK